MILPLKFTTSLPVPPFTVRLGRLAVNAAKSIMSFPAAALMVMEVTLASATLAGVEKAVIAPPFIE